MKIITKDGVQIDCTVDEYEELYVRGLLGKGTQASNTLDLNNPNYNLEEALKNLPMDTFPKFPKPGEVAVLYGVTVDGPFSEPSPNITYTASSSADGTIKIDKDKKKDQDTDKKP